MSTALTLAEELESLSVERVDIVDDFGDLTVGELGAVSQRFLPTAISSTSCMSGATDA